MSVPLTRAEITAWNAAVDACCAVVYSDGMQLYPELVERLQKLKK